MALNTRDRIFGCIFELADKQPDRLRLPLQKSLKPVSSRQAIYKRHFNNTTEIIQAIRQRW